MEQKTLVNFIFRAIIIGFLVAFFACNRKSPQKPNVVLIFLDDAGFSDFNPFGEPRYPTPNVSRLAEEGRSFYNFYVPQAVCSASRAALMTGCYPGRTRIFGALGVQSPGLDTKYATLGEVMQRNGYVTGCFGKWHLGNQPGRRPISRGFDESCGLMYSNDMWPFHPEHPDKYPPLPYWENDVITIDTITHQDQKMLTTWYTEAAVDFIGRHSDEPFFLYLPHSMVHVPLFCSDKFINKSGTGLYGDVIMELDWSVGEIMKAIEKNELEDNTLFIFIGSDNGPTYTYIGNHSGSTPFRAGKGTIFDGGVRNNCIIKFPGNIEPNTISHNAFCSIDILPTICQLTGAQLPKNEIDGRNVWDLIIEKPGAINPHDYYAFSFSSKFQGVISGDGHWKLHLPHEYVEIVKGGKDGQPGEWVFTTIDTTLFDMIHDPYEKANVVDLYPDIVNRLASYAIYHKQLFY